MRIYTTAKVLALVLIASLMTGCTMSQSVITGKKRAYAYTWQQEVQLGREADPQIVAQYGVYDDEELNAYVTRIGETVLERSHLRRNSAPAEYQETKFTFRVLDSPVVNAFALPGGYIYVTRGLMAHLQNEAQLAVVLGHEIGHVVARHSSQRALSGTLAQVGVIAGAIGGSMLGVDPGQILQGGGMAAQLLLMRYSRDNERESDALGVEYAAIAGYKAEEGSKFFTTLKRISEQSGQSIPGFMSTHPDPGEREQTIPQVAERYAGKNQMLIVKEQEYLLNIDGMVFGDDPRQGFVEGGMFHHPVLKFSYPIPSDWLYQNSPQQVLVASTEQDAYIIFDIDPQAQTAADAARNLGNQEGITVGQSGGTTVNGLRAHTMEAQAVDQNNNTLQILGYFIEYDGRVYRFIGLTSAQQYATYSRLFESTMRGFRRLTDQRLINKQPLRLDITQANRAGSFSTFVPNNLPQSLDAEQLAIVNQLNLGTIINQGQALKLVR